MHYSIEQQTKANLGIPNRRHKTFMPRSEWRVTSVAFVQPEQKEFLSEYHCYSVLTSLRLSASFRGGDKENVNINRRNIKTLRFHTA